MENINTLNIKLNENEKKVLNKVNDIYELLKNKNKNINELIEKIKELTGNDEKTLYLKSLLYPEKYKGIKIPNDVPLPSCTFQLHTTKLISLSNTSVPIFIFNPFFLYEKGNCIEDYKDYLPPSYYYQNYGKEIYIDRFNPKFKNSFKYKYLTTMCAKTGDTTYYPLDFDQGVNGLYSQYRLVSACIMLKYIGRLENVSGVLGGTILTNNFEYVGGNISVIDDNGGMEISLILPGLDEYSNYQNYLNTIYHKQVNPIDGIKLVYFPLDNTFEEYKEIIKPTNVIGNKDFTFLKLDHNYINNFRFYIYGLGLPNAINNIPNFKLDIYCNFECLPNPELSDFLPLNIYNSNLNIKNKQDIINIIKNKCVMKLNDFDNILDWKKILLDLKQKKIKLNYMNLENNLKEFENEINKLNEIQIKKEKELKEAEKIEEKKEKEKEERFNNENIKNDEIKLSEDETELKDINKEEKNDINEIKKNDELIKELNNENKEFNILSNELNEKINDEKKLNENEKDEINENEKNEVDMDEKEKNKMDIDK